MNVNIHPIYDSTESEPSVSAGSSVPPRPRPILLPPVQFNTASELPRNDIHGMQRVASYRSTNTVAQVEDAARSGQAAREMSQIMEDLASVEEDKRNVYRMSLIVDEMRAMGRSVAPHAFSQY